jgi:heme a synthase
MTAAMAHSIPPVAGKARRLAPVRAWLYGLAALVLVMVSLGGATRLTGSGLAITEWKPVIGMLPPLSQQDWQEEFRKYQQIPQYEHVNKGMSLDAFKVIFWWEWGHRNLGRLIGIVFALPFVFFLLGGYISRDLSLKLAVIFALGAIQGLVGWYMVSSGLAERIDVSQYRLALHLALAVLILGLLLWTALSLRQADAAATTASPDLAAGVIVILVFVQILLGALVAGLKAGQAYNTWPLMDGSFIPPGLGAMRPWYLNFFENAMTVQFNHRIAAYGLVAAVLWRAGAVLRASSHRGELSSAVCLALCVLVQLGLGIWTLLNQVPAGLGIAHQAIAATLLAVAVWHLYESQHLPAASRC